MPFSLTAIAPCCFRRRQRCFRHFHAAAFAADADFRLLLRHFPRVLGADAPAHAMPRARQMRARRAHAGAARACSALRYAHDAAACRVDARCAICAAMRVMRAAVYAIFAIIGFRHYDITPLDAISLPLRRRHTPSFADYFYVFAIIYAAATPSLILLFFAATDARCHANAAPPSRDAMRAIIDAAFAIYAAAAFLRLIAIYRFH